MILLVADGLVESIKASSIFSRSDHDWTDTVALLVVVDVVAVLVVVAVEEDDDEVADLTV